MFRWPSIAQIILYGALCFTASAQQSTAPTPAAPAAEKPAAPATPAASSTESDLVVARVSGEPITEKQVLSRIDLLSKQTILKPEQQNQRNTLLFKGAVEDLVTLAILKSEAKKQNITADKAKVDQQMQQLASRYHSPEEFKKAIQSQSLTEAEVRQSIEENLCVQQLLDNATKGVAETSDADVQKFYDENPEKFPVPERAHIAHIFLKVDPASSPDQKAEIKKKLEGIRAEIESKTITFADAAVKFSQDATNAPKGGDLGFISRGQMGKQLEDSIFGTAPGAMTPVIESQTGYHLIEVIEIKPAGKATLEQAKPAIKVYLNQVARQAAVQKYMQELRAKATVLTFMTAEEFDKRHPVQ